jgi:hypothetical protein
MSSFPQSGLDAGKDIPEKDSREPPSRFSQFTPVAPALATRNIFTSPAADTEWQPPRVTGLGHASQGMFLSPEQLAQFVEAVNRNRAPSKSSSCIQALPSTPPSPVGDTRAARFVSSGGTTVLSDIEHYVMNAYDDNGTPLADMIEPWKVHSALMAYRIIPQQALSVRVAQDANKAWIDAKGKVDYEKLMLDEHGSYLIHNKRSVPSVETDLRYVPICLFSQFRLSVTYQ